MNGLNYAKQKIKPISKISNLLLVLATCIYKGRFSSSCLKSVANCCCWVSSTKWHNWRCCSDRSIALSSQWSVCRLANCSSKALDQESYSYCLLNKFWNLESCETTQSNSYTLVTWNINTNNKLINTVFNKNRDPLYVCCYFHKRRPILMKFVLNVPQKGC